MKKLTDEKEKELYYLMKEGDKDAANILAESVKAWAYRLAYTYSGRGIDDEELESIAYCAVSMAMAKWNIKRGKLTTCSYWYITGALRKAVQCDNTLIHYPQTKIINKIKRVELEFPLIDKNNLNFDFKDYFSHLPEQNKTVLLLRLQRYSMEEVGEKLKLTRQRIQQIEKQSKKILKKYYL